MSAQGDYDRALAVYEAAAAEFERRNAQQPGSPEAMAAYAAAQEVYAPLVAAHEALTASLREGGSDADERQDGAPPASGGFEDPVPEAFAAGTSGPEAFTPDPPEQEAVAPAPQPESFGISGFDDSPLQAAPEVSPGHRSDAGGGAVLRRGTVVHMTPQPAAQDIPVPGVLRRNMLHANAQSKKAEISRNRRIVGNLPEWNPLPPGEITAPMKRRRQP